MFGARKGTGASRTRPPSSQYHILLPNFNSMYLLRSRMDTGAIVIKILSRISVGGISVVSVVLSVCSSLYSGRWLVGPFRTSNKLFYLTRPQLALLKSLTYNDRCIGPEAGAYKSAKEWQNTAVYSCQRRVLSIVSECWRIWRVPSTKAFAFSTIFAGCWRGA